MPSPRHAPCHAMSLRNKHGSDDGRPLPNLPIPQSDTRKFPKPKRVNCVYTRQEPPMKLILLLVLALIAAPIFAGCYWLDRDDFYAARDEARRARIEAMREARQARDEALRETRA